MSDKMPARNAKPPLALHLRILIILPAITILWSATVADSLTCYCNHNLCQGDDFCETAPHRESYCFKSVKRHFNQDNGTFENVGTYGCISGGEGSLGPLQCFTKTLRFKDPLFIKCCKGEDYCNDPDLISDPTEADDKRWAEPEPVEHNHALISLLFYNWQLLLTIAIIVILIGVISLIARMASRFIRTRSKSSKASNASTFSFEADLEKSTDPHVISSSASTHSYSISDDSVHKPQSSNGGDISFIPDEKTSGVGEQVFEQRTMAREVGFGKTDHVGNGRFGRVFRGQYHGEDVAVKAFQTIDQESWKREDTIFRALNHDNIVRFIASEVTTVGTTTEIWMFLEYCPYGSLCDFLDHNVITGPDQAIKILYSIINGLNYLHEDYAQLSSLYKPSIAHRDIKSKNILMKTPEICCIADFGHALIKINEQQLDYGKYMHLEVGTIRYMAPEILRPNLDLYNYREFWIFAQADLYQYGLILWEVCHRTALDVLHMADNHKLPYEGVVPQNPDIQDMVKIVCEDQYRPPRYEKWNKHPLMTRLAELMVECWRPNAKARMQTLGVKKRLRTLYNQVMPLPEQLSTNLPLPPLFRLDSNKTRSRDVTL